MKKRIQSLRALLGFPLVMLALIPLYFALWFGGSALCNTIIDALKKKV